MNIETLNEVRNAFENATVKYGGKDPALLTLLLAGSTVCRELMDLKAQIQRGGQP